jgi:hypothetical protein
MNFLLNGEIKKKTNLTKLKKLRPNWKIIYHKFGLKNKITNK